MLQGRIQDKIVNQLVEPKILLHMFYDGCCYTIIFSVFYNSNSSFYRKCKTPVIIRLGISGIRQFASAKICYY